MQAKFIKEIGTRAYLRIYWGKGCPKMGCHDAMKIVAESDKLEDFDLDNGVGGKLEDYKPEDWPTQCNNCGKPVPNDEFVKLNYQVHRKRIYDSPSGLPEAGNLYWCTWLPENMYWDNHKGPQLMAVLPNGKEWNMDSRASNCSMKDDKTHRCWCWKGDPETDKLTVDKNGHTCNAGAGSIAAGDYHGFLRDGIFT